MVDATASKSSRGWLTVIGIFALGVVFGGALSVVMVHHGGRFSPLRARFGGGAGLHQRMARQLDLDAAQQEKIRAIVDHGHERMRGILEETRKEIRAELRSDQRERFDRMRMPGSPR